MTTIGPRQTVTSYPVAGGLLGLFGLPAHGRGRPQGGSAACQADGSASSEPINDARRRRQLFFMGEQWREGKMSRAVFAVLICVGPVVSIGHGAFTGDRGNLSCWTSFCREMREFSQGRFSLPMNGA